MYLANIWYSQLFQIVKRYHHVLLFPYLVWGPNSTILFHQIFFPVLLSFVSIGGNVTGIKFKGEPINAMFCCGSFGSFSSLGRLSSSCLFRWIYLQSAINTFRIPNSEFALSAQSLGTPCASQPLAL